MFTWRAVRFLNSPSIADASATAAAWCQQYDEYAKRQAVQIVRYPSVTEWLSIAEGAKVSQFKSRQQPCVGFTLGGVSNGNAVRLPISTIDLWFSETPRLEWEFEEARQQIFLRQFVRTLLRRESIHLIVYDNLGLYLGWNYAVYVWLTYKKTGALWKKTADSLDDQSRRVSTFLTAARSFADKQGCAKRISVKSRRDKHQLEELFREVPAKVQ